MNKFIQFMLNQKFKGAKSLLDREILQFELSKLLLQTELLRLQTVVLRNKITAQGRTDSTDSLHSTVVHFENLRSSIIQMKARLK